MDAVELERNRIKRISPVSKLDFGWLLPALILTVTAVIGGLLFLFLDDSRQTTYSKLFLLPWVGLCAVVIATPAIILFYKRKFDIFHPLVFAAWSYFVPAFVLGGFLLAVGATEPVFMHLIENPEVDLPLTFLYIAIGFGSLSLGFALPFGRKIGSWLSKKTPVWDWRPADVVFPSIILLVVGVFFFFSAWFAGSVGYQKIDVNDSLGTVNYFLSLVALVGSLLIWLFIFKTKNLSLAHLVSLGFLMLVSLSRIALSGSKSSLLLIVLLIAMAFVYSGRQLKVKHAVIFGVIGVIALLFGVVYGTTFRQLKASEDKTDLAHYLSFAEKTVEVMLTQDPTKTLGDGLYGVAERIEVGSSLAVVVSNYEKLAPYEAAYGLDNNIWTYTWTAFIPRFIWADKPVISDARAYSDLYFDYGENSFAITPMGDLLRNFGPVGVPLGMVLLGFVLRIIYAGLIENQTVTMGRVAAYYLLITSVSYEGFYGTILPSLLRAAFIVAISLIFIDFMTKRQR
jgi:hypothetical protein